MVVIGITGGIGSGKGLATEFCRSRGAVVIDADEVARELTRAGEPLVEKIAAEFGQEFLREDGSLDRRKLARSVFRDAKATTRLNRITHPPIMAAIEQEIERLAAEGKTKVVCVVAPLLLEAGYGHGDKVDRVLVMVAEEGERVRRVMKRDGLTEEEVRQRMSAQMPMDEQRRRGDWVVDTTAGKEQALRQLERVWEEITSS
jgi:dephospho-CoA kinase